MAYGGRLDFPAINNDNQLISVGIKQLHLEQDSSQIIPGQKAPGGHLTLVDYNRAGTCMHNTHTCAYIVILLYTIIYIGSFVKFR